MTHKKAPIAESPADPLGRRGFLGRISSIAMIAGLGAGYGTFAGYAGRFLYPARAATAKRWVFVADLASMKDGAQFSYRTPGGAPVVVARQGASGGTGDFIALSSTCPHLGCQVHFEATNNRFFCPCHNGTFDASGKPTGGPPMKAGQSLSRYPLDVKNGLLFIELGDELGDDARTVRSGGSS